MSVKGLIEKCTAWWNYFNQGVWEDPRRTRSVAFIKTMNLSMRSFLNSKLWMTAGALTYYTMLAIVPALALIFAICRGFGFSNLLEAQIQQFFPAQSGALAQGLKFVDSYLANANEGVFVGAGIIFLLWTLYSLMSNVEDAFNEAWNVPRSRTVWRQITDYTAIFFILPILLILSSGINLLMSSTLQHLLPWDRLQGVVSVLLDSLSWVLIWLFFTGTYLLIPNTKVKFKYALIAGVIAGTGFMIVEWLFVSGQMYVARYNAIYGSFSFVPLLLIWLQIVWIITLSGAVVCYAMQNIYNLSYLNKVDNISIAYREKVAIAVMSVIVKDFKAEKTPPTPFSVAHDYRLPANLVSIVVQRLERCGLIRRLVPEKPVDEPGMVPAVPVSTLTVAQVVQALNRAGDSDFIPDFDEQFGPVNEVMAKIGALVDQAEGSTLVYNL